VTVVLNTDILVIYAMTRVLAILTIVTIAKIVIVVVIDAMVDIL
jgi:hypothetical protein